jgi:hypothetical protein
METQLDLDLDLWDLSILSLPKWSGAATAPARVRSTSPSVSVQTRGMKCYTLVTANHGTVHTGLLLIAVGVVYPVRE